VNNILKKIGIFRFFASIDYFRGEISLMGEIRGYGIFIGRIISIEGYERI